jgi:hypothetical protein
VKNIKATRKSARAWKENPFLIKKRCFHNARYVYKRQPSKEKRAAVFSEKALKNQEKAKTKKFFKKNKKSWKTPLKTA